MFKRLPHLMPEDEARDSSHELSQEHQGQKHGILTGEEEVTTGLREGG